MDRKYLDGMSDAVMARAAAHPAVAAALDAGELTPEAASIIEAEMLAEFERRRQVSQRLIEDADMRRRVTRHYQARATAQIRASRAYRDAYRSVMGMD